MIVPGGLTTRPSRSRRHRPKINIGRVPVARQTRARINRSRSLSLSTKRSRPPSCVSGVYYPGVPKGERKRRPFVRAKNLGVFFSAGTEIKRSPVYVILAAIWAAPEIREIYVNTGNEI